MKPVNKIVLSGEWKAVRDIARKNGCSLQKSRELLIAMRNAFKNIASDVDVYVTKPREINITGAHINSEIVKGKVDYTDICELHRKSTPNTEILGSIVAATPEGVCKGIFIAPEKALLESYVQAAKKLSQSDFSVEKNYPGSILYIN